MIDLSILIPSRNELFLAKTIQDILEHGESDYEIIAVLDGLWSDPAVVDHPRVNLIYHPESIGQRAATNDAARVASGKYVMKVDAHCAFDQGFDVKLLAHMQDDWTVVPVMRNLHAFDWVCPEGHRRYQGPSGVCRECGQETVRDVVWIAKTNPQSTSYCFDPEPHFQYFNDYKKRPEGKGDLTETMSLQGSCFMIARDRYFDLNVCDEQFGSWGSQGIEVAVKSWLSGGRVIVNHHTWYAHMFRTQGGDFSFPYHLSGRQVDQAKKTARELFFNNKWPRQVYPLSWLVEKFWPVPHWTEEDLAEVKKSSASFGVAKPLTRGIIYYTDNKLDERIMKACQEQIVSSVNGHKIVSASLQPIDFGNNVVVNEERGYLAMFKQILAGLEALDTDIVFLCEHDVLYHPSHFEFVPPEHDKIYYNLNFWKVDANTGHALHYDAKQTSGLCAYRDVLLVHYRERVRRTEEKLRELGNSREYRRWIRAQGFEPGTHNRSERVDDLKSDSWWSTAPNIDIRHGHNLTPSRWSQDQFRDKRSCRNWQEAESIDGWGAGVDLIKVFS